MPRRQPDNLMMKFRLTVTRRMPKSEAVAKLRTAVRTGYVPEGIEIAWLDWANDDRKGHLREGQIDGDAWEDLRAFYGALSVADIRAERTD